MRKFGELVSVGHKAGEHGESVKSMLGVGDCRLLSSAVESVKIVARRVFIAGPAGYQNSEQAPEEPMT
jgi:hypothetical protein